MSENQYFKLKGERLKNTDHLGPPTKMSMMQLRFVMGLPNKLKSHKRAKHEGDAKSDHLATKRS